MGEHILTVRSMILK